ncbi:class I SAM-dependent methyltransferase [Oceaniserpentilla sp. 4NH20-0058]|uniref:methyltransferase n=1 Tax=Oceaniserpentilla sp. 4NH20-0058 TaxID=3127660 RepID=UPI003109C7DE
MLKETLDCPFGQFELVRPGAHPKQPLRAWDAADEYLIKQYSEHYKSTPPLILNDQFGALGCALSKSHPIWQSDSYCAHEALKLNLQINEHQSEVSILNSLDTPSKTPNLALIKIPKNISYLEYQLQTCYELGTHDVLLAGMMKHLPKNILELLQKYGTVKRLPFIKKATVYSLNLSKHHHASYPKNNQFMGVRLSSHANVFGRDKLDSGAQFFLENLAKIPSSNIVADLCCGSGILGIKFAQNHENAQIDFYDESYMSVRSSQESWALNQLPQKANFYWNDGLGSQTKPYELILCNPPFHEAHTVGDHIAKRLFKQCQQALRQSGHLIVVGNRHLNYHQTLKRYFKNVDLLATNSKFVLLSAHG